MFEASSELASVMVFGFNSTKPIKRRGRNSTWVGCVMAPLIVSSSILLRTFFFKNWGFHGRSTCDSVCLHVRLTDCRRVCLSVSVRYEGLASVKSGWSCRRRSDPAIWSTVASFGRHVVNCVTEWRLVLTSSLQQLSMWLQRVPTPHHAVLFSSHSLSGSCCIYRL